jgi:hypothetical protein
VVLFGKVLDTFFKEMRPSYRKQVTGGVSLGTIYFPAPFLFLSLAILAAMRPSLFTMLHHDLLP